MHSNDEFLGRYHSINGTRFLFIALENSRKRKESRRIQEKEKEKGDRTRHGPKKTSPPPLHLDTQLNIPTHGAHWSSTTSELELELEVAFVVPVVVGPFKCWETIVATAMAS